MQSGRRRARSVDSTSTADYSGFGPHLNPARERRGQSENEMNLPNSLTTLRIFFVPLLVVVLLTPPTEFRLVGTPLSF